MTDTNLMAHNEPVLIDTPSKSNNLLHLDQHRYHNGTNMAQQKRVMKIDAARRPRNQASAAGKLYSSRGDKFTCKFRLPERYREKLEQQMETYGGLSMAMYLELVVVDFLESDRELSFHRRPNVNQK